MASQVQVRYAELPTSSPSNPTRSEFYLANDLLMKRLCVWFLAIVSRSLSNQEGVI